MKTQIVKFLKDEEGATAIEYGLVAGLIAIVLVAALNATGTSLIAMFNKIIVALGGTAVALPT